MDIESPPVIEKPARRQEEAPEIGRRKIRFRSPLILWAGAAIFAFALFKGVDFIEVDKEGNVTLSLKRQKKLDKEVKVYDDDLAEQYVLVAIQDGWYPCFSCPNSTVIYLHAGEVWKYGITTKGGEAGRYGKSLGNKKLLYYPQFEGTVSQCLAEERRKIYGYALLPENLKRNPPLMRPPGHKKDS